MEQNEVWLAESGVLRDRLVTVLVSADELAKRNVLYPDLCVTVDEDTSPGDTAEEYYAATIGPAFCRFLIGELRTYYPEVFSKWDEETLYRRLLKENFESWKNRTDLDLRVYFP